MADSEAVRPAGLPERITSPGTPASASQPVSPSQPSAEPEKVMTLVDHLTELRTRIVRSILAIVVGSAVGFLVHERLQDVLLAPLPAVNLPLQVLAPGDAFSVVLQISVITGVILAMPVLLYQLWAFISPGLTPNER